MAIEEIKPINTDGVITISNLIDQRSIYNLTPPYQRGNVWSKEWKIDLIESILRGLPLAPITLVQKENDGEIEYLVLDGKQRLSAVFDFIDGEFELPIQFDDKIEKLKYDDLVRISKDKKHKLYTKIQKSYFLLKNYNFRAIIYPEISWNDQIHLFEKINHSKQLSKYEKFNSSYIFVKSFADCLFKQYAPICSGFIADNSKLSNDGKDLTFKFRIISGLMGAVIDKPKINLETFPADAVKEDFKKFMHQLNNQLEKYMIDKDDQYLFDSIDRVSKMFEEFKWNDAAYNFKTFDKIFSIISSLNSKNYIYSLIYFSFFVLEKIQNKTLTFNMIDKNRLLIEDLYKQYYDWTIEDGADQRRISRAGSSQGRKYHSEKLNDIFSNSKLDLGIKNQPFTQLEKDKIFSDADGKCEICGSTDNLQYDHVNPASLSSIKIGGLLCETHNRSKSDNTIKDCDDIVNYIKKKIVNG